MRSSHAKNVVHEVHAVQNIFFCFIQEDDCSSINYIKQLQKKKELAYSNEF